MKRCDFVKKLEDGSFAFEWNREIPDIYTWRNKKENIPEPSDMTLLETVKVLLYS